MASIVRASWLLGVVLLAPVATVAAGQPNIVVIVADDLGWADVGFHGGPYSTPNLDRLAREGVELTQHYVAPVCSPTRAALLTGRYWSRFGVNSPTNERAFRFDTVTLAGALKSVGYETAIMGKWHLGSKSEWGPQHFRFDHSYGSLAGGVGPYNHLYKRGPYSQTWHRNGQLLEQHEGHVTDLLTEEAVDWIAARGTAPFFVYVPYTAVHIPIDEPRRWLDQYAQLEPLTRQHYAACVTHLDHSVGRILEALHTSGHANNTLVVFFSDNGGTTVRNNDPQYPGDYPEGPAFGNNKPLRGAKGSLYEGGIRVPAVAWWPGVLPAGVCDTPLHVIDWMPTFVALAGYTPRDDLRWDGMNVWPTITGAVDCAPRPLYWKGGPRSRAAAVRDGDWKLILTAADEGELVELFNLADDPNEQRNRAAEQTERVAQLRTRLAELAAADDDTLPTDSR